MLVATSTSFELHVVNVGGKTPPVALFTFRGLPCGKDWHPYEQAYLSLYRSFPTFIILFDTRNIDFPSLDVIQNVKALLQRLKHRTVSQVPAVIVLTQFQLIKELVLTVIKAGGQAAPFFISTDPDQVVQYAADVATFSSGKNVPRWWQTRPGLVSIRDAGTATILALVLQQFVIFSRHFVRLYFLNP